MEAFTTLTAVAAPFERTDIDTDQIIPARFLKYPRKDGYGRFLFHDLRFDAEGRERPEFILNRPEFRAARIVVANSNFGCGSSREGAVYALVDYGIRAVVAPSFSDIFHNNCLKNGVLPVRLPDAQAANLREKLNGRPGSAVTVDLKACTLTDPDGETTRFSVDPFWREALLKGLDEIGLTLSYRDDIAAFEQRYRAEMPWLF